MTCWSLDAHPILPFFAATSPLKIPSARLGLASSLRPPIRLGCPAPPKLSLFSAEGGFVRLPLPPAGVAEELFRRRVLRMLVRRGRLEDVFIR